MEFSIDDDGFVDNGEASFHLNEVQAHQKAKGQNGEFCLVFVLSGNNLIITFADEVERNLIYDAIKNYKKMLHRRMFAPGESSIPLPEPKAA